MHTIEVCTTVRLRYAISCKSGSGQQILRSPHDRDLAIRQSHDENLFCWTLSRFTLFSDASLEIARIGDSATPPFCIRICNDVVNPPSFGFTELWVK